jgi:hypothetical protein
MAVQSYEQLISDGIRGLPAETLAEIADFVYFVRKRVLQPEHFNGEIQQLLLGQQPNQLSRDEELHLEEEFKDYDQFYPRE